MSDQIKKNKNQDIKNKNDNESKWKYVKKNDEHFFFMHIPKSGGTSFRNILYNHFEKQDLWPNRTDLKNLGFKYPTYQVILDTYRPKLRTTLVTGHYGLNMLNHLPPTTKILVFFRNPMDRSLSLLKHLYEKHGGEFEGDINDFLKQNLMKIVSTEKKMLGFANKPIVQKQLNNTISDFHFVGITEKFDLSIELCNKIFGWELENIAPLNVRNNEMLKDLTSASRALIVRYLIPQIRIYNQAFLRFEKLCQVHLDINKIKV